MNTKFFNLALVTVYSKNALSFEVLWIIVEVLSEKEYGQRNFLLIACLVLYNNSWKTR